MSQAKVDPCALAESWRNWSCAALRQSLPEPADCNWPLCDCDPYAAKVVEALEENFGAPADEIERLRKGLSAAIAGLGSVSVRCMDTPTSPLKPYGDIARDALLNVLKLVGPSLYDELVIANLTQPPETGSKA